MSAGSRRRRKPLVFIDSNIILCGMLRPNTPASALLSVACLKQAPYRLALADFVRQEIENNLSQFGLIESFRKTVDSLKPHIIRLPTEDEVHAIKGWIRHQHDEPVLASALIAPHPDIIVSDNTKDFTAKLSRRIGIPILPAVKFMAKLELHLTQNPTHLPESE